MVTWDKRKPGDCLTESSTFFSTPKPHSLTFEPSNISTSYLDQVYKYFRQDFIYKNRIFSTFFVRHEDRLQIHLPSTAWETPETQILHKMAPTKFYFHAIAVMLLCIASIDAHMMMLTPTPYGKSTLNNSPLIASGSDFPCKQRAGVYDLEGASNTMVIGEPQTLSFIGSAVHGGGSCQVSLTTDLQPTASTKWMVIHSIQGNCPSNVTGNLPDDASGLGAAVFQYTIPTGIAPGQYTIAWSWSNKIGNREFYMNCGPATITAPTKKRYAPAPKVSKRQSSFPDMFVANLQSVNSCVTVEGQDVLYPDPGSSVVNGTIGVNFPPQVVCGGAAAVAPGSASSVGTSPVASPTSPGVGTSSPAVPSTTASSGVGSDPSAASSIPASGASSAGSPGVFATGASSAPPLATSTAVVSPIPASSAPAAASSVASAAAPGASGTTTTTGAQSGPCTNEGAWYCLAGGSSFQRCASGMWSTPMAMAAGTTCTPGMSDTLSMTAAKSKRFSNHLRRTHRLEEALKA
jgi:hypothetical protein